MNAKLCHRCPMTDQAPNRMELARRVRAARSRMYGTVDSARIAAGVSRGAWDHVEKGEPVQAFTLAKVEKALGWPEGFALAVLDNSAPEVPPAVTSLRDHVSNSPLSPAVKRAILALIESDAEGGEEGEGDSAAIVG